MLDHDDLTLVAALAQAGGPRPASLALNTHAATVYRRLKALEARLGSRLFERVDGRYRPTELGRKVVTAAERSRLQLAELNRKLAGADPRMTGWIAATTTDSLAPIVCEAIAVFRLAYPGIGVRLSISNGFADMTRHEAEVAIRPTRTPSEALFGRRAARFDYGVYARADAPEAWIALDESLAAIPSSRWLAERVCEEQIVVRTNSMWAAAEACAAGLGQALLPSYLAVGLERREGPIPEIASEVWVLTHQDLRSTPRIRAFTGAVADHLQAKIAPG